MQIERLNVESLREYMGPAASQEDARRMMMILARERVSDTREVTDSQWLAWCAEAAGVTP